MIKHGHSAARAGEKSTGTFISFKQPASKSWVTQHTPKTPAERTHCTQHHAGDPKTLLQLLIVLSQSLVSSNQPCKGARERHWQPLCWLQPGLSISRRAGMFPGWTQVPALLSRAHQCKASTAKSPARRLLAAEKDSEPHVAPRWSNKSHGSTKPGETMEVEPPLLPAPPHISSPGQDHQQLPITAEGSRASPLQSPPLTQICLKGSGAVAPSLQARFRRFQGTASLCSKLAAKNGTPPWQGDMLLVLGWGTGDFMSSFGRRFGQITTARWLHCRHISQPATER